MVFDSVLLNAIVDILNPFKIIGNVRNAVNPVVTLVDGLLGYEDFKLCYGGKPEENDIKPKMVYFYEEKGKLYCISKEFGIELNSDDLGLKTFQEMTVILADPTKKAKLTTSVQSTLYDFLKLNGVEVGIKSSLHENIATPYNKFETAFIAKNPLIYKQYLVCKQGINNLCTFAASQTGLRIAGIISATAIAVASGGTMAAVMAGAYAASIGISIIQQVYSKTSLNRLAQEAELLTRYNANQKALGLEGQTFTKAKLSDQPPHGAVRKWLSASAKHLSTYFFEAAVPLAAAVLSPVNGVITGLQFGLFVGGSSVGVGVGMYLRKLHEDEKDTLKIEINKVKNQSNIPDYNNIYDLQKKIIEQEKSLKKPEVDKDVSLQKRSRVQEYSQALIDVINPFSDYQEVKDPKIFARTVAGVAVSITAAAALSSGMSPDMAAMGLTTTVIATAGVSAVTTKRAHIKEKRRNSTIDREFQVTQQQATKAIAQKPKNKSISLLQKKHKSYVDREIYRQSVRSDNLERGKH